MQEASVHLEILFTRVYLGEKCAVFLKKKKKKRKKIQNFQKIMETRI